MATITNAIKLGADCTFTVDGTALPGITSVSITCESESIDVSTRESGNFSAELPGKKSVSVDLNFRRYAEGTNATAQDAIYTTWLSETPTGLTIVAGGGLLTISGVFVVESIEESQELDDSVTVSVSLKNYGTVTRTTTSGGSSGTGT